MEPFLFYLLRASVVMALFYGFYKLFFGKNTFHRMNRIMLILLSIAVCILPLFRFSLLPEKKQESVMAGNFMLDLSEIPVVAYNAEPPATIPWLHILFALFATGLAFAVTRYLIGLLQLTRIIRKSEKQILADHSVLCVTEQEVSPCSWFNHIVLSRNDMNADNRTIINHERAHIHLLHSLDMVFFDLFTCVFWFNPFSWLLRREMQSVHEYQADDRVIQNGIDAKQYQLLLIRKSVGEHKFSLANNFRQRDLHKRINMMTKSRTDKRMRWGYSVALPMLFLAMVTLSVPKLNAKAVEKGVENSSENEKITTQTGDSVIIAEALIDLTKNPLELENVRILAKDSLNIVISFEEKLTVSGFVKGKDGFLPGVAVLIKGSTAGTVTDTEGKFVIKADRGDVLQFKIADYKLFEYKVEKAENNLVISLQPEEVLVVGSAKREDIEIDTNKIVIRGNPSTITDGKVVFGSVNELSVRGVSDDKKPLIVIDEEVMGADFELNSIDPNEVYSITILKNKPAIEVYGEKGKNGVIIITMKTNE